MIPSIVNWYGVRCTTQVSLLLKIDNLTRSLFIPWMCVYSEVHVQKEKLKISDSKPSFGPDISFCVGKAYPLHLVQKLALADMLLTIWNPKSRIQSNWQGHQSAPYHYNRRLSFLGCESPELYTMASLVLFEHTKGKTI